MCPQGQGQSEDEDAVPTPPKSRLGSCEVCKEVEAKYTCPACECTTCSVQCSKKHKKDQDCDGVRVRTSFVKLNEFGNLHLLSDYRLLDDISCKVDNCHRDKLKKDGSQPYPHQYHNKSTKLKQAVLSRGSDFVILPNQFVRHRNNPSMYDVRNKLIKWRVQMTFLNASRFTVYEDRCSEETVLGTLLEKLLNTSPESNLLTHKKLETYRKQGLKNITVLMKAERVPMSDKKFYKLDPEKSLRENFVGKTIVEYPQLFLVLTGCFTVKKPLKDTLLPRNTVKTNYLLSSNENPGGRGSMTRTPLNKVMEDSSESEPEDDSLDMDMDTGVTKLPSYQDLIQLRRNQ